MSDSSRSSRSLTVLLIGNFLSSSTGTRNVCEDLAKRLRLSGWTVFTTSTRFNRIGRFVDMLVTTWIHRHRYQVAHIDVYSGSAFIWAEIVAWLLSLLDKPFILTLRGGNLPHYSVRWPGRVGRLLRSATVVTTPSPYLLRAMQPYGGHLHMVANPLDLDAYKFRLRHSPQANLIWLRAFHSIYNPTLAPQVIAYLLSDFPNIHLIMVGPDKGDGSFQETQRIAEELGVLDKIDFPGAVSKSEVPTWLNKGDIFLNTTNVDNTPVSVIEAMACGLCVISTDAGGISFMLEHEQDALLVPPNSVAAMATAVRRVLVESSLARKLSQNGSQKAARSDWSTILPEWKLLFRKVAQKHV